MFIGGSLLSSPTSLEKWDRQICLTGKQPCQSRTGALGHLAVLLCRPAVCTTELATAHVARELACEHEPLVSRELTRDLTDAPQVVAQQRESLDVGAGVGDIDSATIASREWEGGRDCRLDRATPAQRAATIMDTREEPLLESIGDVGVAGERFPAPSPCQQLQRRLAVAVFEILAPEAVAVGGEQQLAARAGDERNRFEGIEHAEPSELADSCGARRDSLAALLSDGHASMSV
jgi:hypothetical protein